MNCFENNLCPIKESTICHNLCVYVFLVEFMYLYHAVYDYSFPLFSLQQKRNFPFFPVDNFSLCFSHFSHKYCRQSVYISFILYKFIFLCTAKCILWVILQLMTLFIFVEEECVTTKGGSWCDLLFNNWYFSFKLIKLYIYNFINLKNPCLMWIHEKNTELNLIQI